MKLASLYIGTVLCGAGVLAAADPTAWSKTSWGMSDAEIRAALEPGQVRDVAERLRVGDKVEPARVGIPKISIAGTDFRVYFLTDPGGLHQISLQPIDKADATDAVFHSLEAALTLKYGTPFSRAGETSLAQWKTSTSVIRLEFVALKNVPFKSLWLIYIPVPKSDML